MKSSGPSMIIMPVKKRYCCINDTPKTVFRTQVSKQLQLFVLKEDQNQLKLTRAHVQLVKSPLLRKPITKNVTKSHATHTSGSNRMAFAASLVEEVNFVYFAEPLVCIIQN